MSSLSKLLLFICIVSIILCENELSDTTMVSFKKENDTSIAEDIGQSMSKPHQIDSPISMKLKMKTKHSVDFTSKHVFFIMFIVGFVLILFSYLEYVNKVDAYYITDIPMREII